MHKSLSGIILLFGFFTACQQTPQQPVETHTTVEYYSSPAVKERGAPYSEAVRVGDMLYLAGKIGIAPGDSLLATGGIQGETRQSMENIKGVLSHFGASMDDIVKVTVFLAEIEEWGAMNEVYKTFFVDHFPARSAVGGCEIARNGRVEIECIARIP